MINKIYNNILKHFPRIELLVREIYWNHYETFKKFKSNVRNEVKSEPNQFDIKKLWELLDKNNVREHPIVIVHSSYDTIKGCGLTEEEFLEELIKFLGPNITLAMPVIRRFKNEPKRSKTVKKDPSDIIRVYDKNESLVTSGVLNY